MAAIVAGADILLCPADFSKGISGCAGCSVSRNDYRREDSGISLQNLSCKIQKYSEQCSVILNIFKWGLNMIEKLFKLKENNTTVKTEVIGGITTFH